MNLSLLTFTDLTLMDGILFKKVLPFFVTNHMQVTTFCVAVFYGRCYLSQVALILVVTGEAVTEFYSHAQNA